MSTVFLSYNPATFLRICPGQRVTVCLTAMYKEVRYGQFIYTRHQKLIAKWMGGRGTAVKVHEVLQAMYVTRD